MKILQTYLYLTLTALILISCQSSPKKDFAMSPKEAGQVSVMSFNVENLFDTVHDENRSDWTYLPLTTKQKPDFAKNCASQTGWRQKECLEMNWSEDVLKAKMENLSKVVLNVDAGVGPDILMLIEVENDRVVKQWQEGYLQAAGYKTRVVLEGPDERGIDIGFLSRFALVGKPVLHKIPYKAEKPEDQKWMDRSRGILEVTVKLPDGSNLTLFGAHFPSQANPVYWRKQSVQFLKSLIAERSKINPVVAMGDLNITAEEEREQQFFAKDFSEVGAVSHLVGCKHCLGTHNYRGSWSFLDAMIFSPSLMNDGKAPYRVLVETFDVVDEHPVHVQGGRPWRFDEEKKVGVADHFPIYVRLAPRK